MAGAVAGMGITPAEYAVRSVIGVMRAVSPTELAAFLRVPPTTISRHVARMVEAGLAQRAPNPADGRSYLLELTDDGRAVVQRIAPRVRGFVEQLTQRLDVDAIETALVALEEAARSLSLDTTTIRQ
jgi:DNA-binding MarR family transcriptional regulator